MITKKSNKKFLARILIVVMAVCAFLPLQTETAAAAVNKPVMKSVTWSKSGMTAKWTKASGVSGYQLQYASDRLFMKRVTLKVKNTAVSRTVSGVSKAASAYVRVRAYKKVSGKTKYSAWSMYSSVRTGGDASMTALKSGSERFELRTAAGQKVPGYDTLQGSCYGGGYLYCILYNRDKEKCRIAKINMTSMKVVKLSKVLPLHHGNDMTYNPRTRKLIVAHSGSAPKALSIVNPSTLTIESTKSITLPKTLKGMTKTNRKSYKGFGAIAFSQMHNKYVLRLLGSKNLLILNKNFKPVKYINLTTKSKKTSQGIDVYNDFILVGHSFASGKPYNVFYIYDFNGNYLTYIRLNKGMELESIFHTKNYVYVSCYTSYYSRKLIEDGQLFKKVLERDGYIYRLTKF